MKDLSQRISQYAVDGLRDISEHPIKYSSKALKDLVKDYWDAGVAVASGIVLSPAGNGFYGSLFDGSYTSLSLEQKLQIGSVGALISLAGAGIRDAGSSGMRNFYAGLSAILIGIDSSVEGPVAEEALMKIIDALSVAGFVVMEYARRKNMTKVSGASSASNVALEN